MPIGIINSLPWVPSKTAKKLNIQDTRKHDHFSASFLGGRVLIIFH